MNDFKLAALLTKVNLSEIDRNTCIMELQELKTIDQQVLFFDYCKNWKLAPWVFSQLKKHIGFEFLDQSIIDKFKFEYDKVKGQNEQRNATALKFLTEFINAGIDVIILKGNYFALESYQDIGYKRMNDFDILIRRNDWDRIQDIYLRLGYIPLGFGWSGEKEKPASFSHVGMSFISPDFSCIIGSQWGLKSPTASYSVDIEKAWQSAKQFDFSGIKVKSLSSEYNLLHLILHLGLFKCGIRDCMDIYNLVRTEEIDEELMKQIIIDAKAADKAKFALVISNVCSSDISQNLIDSLPSKKSGFIYRRLKKRKRTQAQTSDFQYSYNDYFQDIEKQVIYFNLYPKFHVKLAIYLKILRMIYIPKLEFALKLNDRFYQPTFLQKVVSVLKAPYFVFSLIAQEIGWKFTGLLFIKLAVDLLISLKNYVVRSESYFDYLKGKGINPKDIKNAVKNIQ